MNFLCLDSSTAFPSVSIYIDNHHVDTMLDLDGNSSSLPIITNKIIKKNSFKFIDFSSISITVGPGSYTGIRVGLSFAQGLAYSLGVNILPVNILDVIAYHVDTVEEILVASYSHSDFVFSTTFNAGKSNHIELTDINKLKGKQVFGIGLDKYKNIINYKSIEFSSKQIGQFSINRYHQSFVSEIGDIKPIYLNEHINSTKA